MLIALFIALGLVAALWLGLALSPWHRVTYRDVLGSATALPDEPADAGALPSVTIVAPARNEAAVLPATVPSYCAQDYPDLHVIVVDDQSDDETPAILERLHERYPVLTVVRAADRPAGWLGKPWAVAQGVRVAVAQWETEARDQSSMHAPPPPDKRSQWLCFTDADCAFHPQAVRTAVRFMRSRDLDMFSMFPRVEFGHACEVVGMQGLLTVLTLMFPGGSINNPKSPQALAAGGFILVRRDAYERFGGHEAVKSQMIEDVQIARKMKAAGCRVQVRLTPDLVSTRMYEGWADMWEGLSKNAYAGMDYQPHKFWVGLLAIIVVAVLPPVYLGLTLWWALAVGSAAAWSAFALAALANVCMALVHVRMVRHLELPAYHAVMMPVSTGLYTAIAVSSAFQHHYRGGNVWKGRRYDRKTLLTAADAAPAAGTPKPVEQHAGAAT